MGSEGQSPGIPGSSDVPKGQDGVWSLSPEDGSRRGAETLRGVEGIPRGSNHETHERHEMEGGDGLFWRPSTADSSGGDFTRSREGREEGRGGSECVPSHPCSSMESVVQEVRFTSLRDRLRRLPDREVFKHRVHRVHRVGNRVGNRVGSARQPSVCSVPSGVPEGIRDWAGGGSGTSHATACGVIRGRSGDRRSTCVGRSHGHQGCRR